MISESTWMDTIEPAGICSYESEVHGIRIVGGDEVEGEKRNSKESNKSVYTGALVWSEDLPPFHRPIS
ncbi:unnamed protein product, partial [Vitis vinifera]